MSETRSDSQKLSTIADKLACPSCKTNLDFQPEQLTCQDCQITFPIKNGQIQFVTNTPTAVTSDWLDLIKKTFKQFPKFYVLLYKYVNPFMFRKKSNIMFPYLDGGNPIVLNVGSGPYGFSQKIINLDLFPFPNVDLVADFFSLPMQDESVDGLINEETLEHLPDTEQFFSEAWRVLKPGAYMYISVPFICGYHASPGDYRRWTLEGLKALVQEHYEIIDIGVKAGPTSALLWVFQEWTATVLSFNIKALYKFWYLLLMATTWPLKYLDFLFSHYSSASNIAGDFYVLCRKQ